MAFFIVQFFKKFMYFYLGSLKIKWTVSLSSKVYFKLNSTPERRPVREGLHLLIYYNLTISLVNVKFPIGLFCQEFNISTV